MSELLNGALRWIFWGILYLAVGLTALVICFGTLAPYLSEGIRWAMFAVFLYGIALDARTKAGGRQVKPGPPSDGDLTPVESTNR